jgi:uncharacterized protein
VAELVVLGNPWTPSHPSPSSVRPPKMHLLPGDPPLVFVVEGSRLFEVDLELFESLARDQELEQTALLNEAEGMIPSPPTESALPPHESVPLPPPTAISLNLAHTCNLSCSYCYADEGRFGGHSTMMPLATAQAAIDQLLEKTPRRRVTIGFIGGEPFLNRQVLYDAVEYAVSRARDFRSTVGFSVTTNATLLTDQDIEFLRSRGFAVSVSLDGAAYVNDRNRRARNGGSGFNQAMRAVAPLLQDPGNARVAARATVTRQDLRVAEHIEALVAAGFHEVGVSPLRTSPTPGMALSSEDWPVFLREMVRAAEVEWRHLQSGGHLRFSNLAIALKQLHSGYCKPLPCGSAASYVSVSARGEYFTCHRTVDNPRFTLGSTAIGLSDQGRQDFLRSRHVDLQQPCRSCWARYLCGGGCHAEVLSSGRSGCDYIRGWLEYCLRFYDRALGEFPALFQEGAATQ